MDLLVNRLNAEIQPQPLVVLLLLQPQPGRLIKPAVRPKLTIGAQPLAVVAAGAKAQLARHLQLAEVAPMPATPIPARDLLIADGISKIADIAN